MNHEELKEELASRAADILDESSVKASDLSMETLEQMAQRLLDDQDKYCADYRNETKELIKQIIVSGATRQGYNFLPKLLGVDAIKLKPCSRTFEDIGDKYQVFLESDREVRVIRNGTTIFSGSIDKIMPPGDEFLTICVGQAIDAVLDTVTNEGIGGAILDMEREQMAPTFNLEAAFND